MFVVLVIRVICDIAMVFCEYYDLVFLHAAASWCTAVITSTGMAVLSI